MYTLATAAEMKELDRVAIEEWGIPSLELMENAAKAVAERVHILTQDSRKNVLASHSSLLVMKKSGDEPTPEEQEEISAMREIVEQTHGVRVGIFCGPGNNGGDGVAAARLLLETGYEVRCFLVGNRAKMTPDCKAMEEKLLAAGGRLEPYDPEGRQTAVWLTTCECFVDALFGVGLCREVKGDFLHAILRMNQCRTKIVSCDVPSGVNADTGAIMGAAVNAHTTVTFTHPKPGLYLGEGGPCAGKVEVANIGIPFELTHTRTRHSDTAEVIPPFSHLVLPRRKRTAHKGDFGKVFMLAGSVGYTGAPVFASNAAVRTGAGLVHLGVPADIYPIVAVKCEEAMPFPLPADYDKILEKARSCDVALIGPGLGRAPETERLVRRLLRDLDRPVILDADGINALQGHIHILDERPAPTVLTPHDGEFQRLTGCGLPIPDRLTAARDFAKEHRCVLVLKGHGTITAAPDGKVFVNTTGNPGMAKGGSGDVLAGMIAALWGQKQFWDDPHHLDPYRAQLTAWAVFYHGQAGDRCAGEVGEYGMTPSDMLNAIPMVLKAHTAES